MSHPSNLPPTVIFIHIPKAAGTSFKKVLTKNYRPEEMYFLDGQETEAAFKALPDAEKQQYRLLYGHHYFGLHEVLPQPSTYITFLRDPIERTLSHYHFVRKVKHHAQHEQALQLSLEEYIDQVAKDELENGQTRRLAGSYSTEDCTQDLFETAKANLHDHFSVVGLMERFDETLFFARQSFDWSIGFYLRLNQTSRSKQSPSQAVLNAIRERNQFDIQLYEFVRQQFEAQLQAQPASFYTTLRTFKVLNWCYGLPYQAALSIRRRVPERVIKRGALRRIQHFFYPG
jgi:hypothetical protein